MIARMEPVEAIDAWLGALARANYSPSTLAVRRRVLADIPNLLNPTRDEIQAWWATRATKLDGKPRAASSLAQERSHVRTFYEWCIMQEVGTVTTNPTSWLMRVRTQKRKANPIPEGELLRVVDQAVPPQKQMIVLAALAGLRSAEIAVVRWEDIDRGNGIMWIRQGKGQKDRSVPLSAGLLGELGDPSTGPIIGKSMTAKAVSTAIGRYLRSVDGNYTAHQLRARFCTRFLDATGDINAAAEVMGHADVSTTAMYAVASSDTMRRGVEAAGRIG